jgi:hypothetical protein
LKEKKTYEETSYWSQNRGCQGANATLPQPLMNANAALMRTGPLMNTDERSCSAAEKTADATDFV